jgi:deoxyribodipyrimidine photolyase-related protein
MPNPLAAIVYPHQLYEKQAAVAAAKTVFLVEDPLFFKQFEFHVQKRILHRASMSEFAQQCRHLGKKVIHVESDAISHSGEIGTILLSHEFSNAIAVDPSDDWLKRRVTEGCQKASVQLQWLPDDSFLTPLDVIETWAAGKTHFRFTDFYMMQRKRLGLLLDEKGKPVGGKWTFDTDNRKKLPKGTLVPRLAFPSERPSVVEAKKYVAKNFPNALGFSGAFRYPVTHSDAIAWLDAFIDSRLESFGDFEDAISKQEVFLFHSILTPMLNIGLITPRQIVDRVIAKTDAAPLNSLEGFLRQVIGWREFIRLIYLQAGSRQRTTNAWSLSRPLPESFYTGTTGIVPFDSSVQRTLQHSYCHHIERLMVLGNFMLLCDIEPNAVYRWFMELFIDAYDWVMVPNVYGMSQHADGGLMTTKPYISGSSYLLKMSDYGKGDWCKVWDALYWRFVDRERVFFSSNPRMSVMVGQLDRMGSKLAEHHQIAENFLKNLR